MTRSHNILPDPNKHWTIERKSDGLVKNAQYGWLINDSATADGVVDASEEPLTPPYLSQALSSNQTIDLFWNRQSLRSAKEFVIYRDNVEITRVDGSKFEYEDTGLTNGTSYQYFVTQIDPYGNESGPSNYKTVSPRAGDPPPTSLSCTPGDTQVTLSWTAPTTATPDDYDVYKNGSLEAAGVSGTSKAITGLTNYTEYSFAVKANYGSDQSIYSNVVVCEPVILPDGYIAFSIDGDGLLYVSNGAGVDQDSFELVTSTNVDASRIAFDPSRKIGVYDNTKRIHLLSWNEVSISRDWEVQLGSAFDPQVYGIQFQKDGHLIVGHRVSTTGDAPLIMYNRSDGSVDWNSVGVYPGSDFRDMRASPAIAGGNILWCTFDRDFGGLVDSDLVKLNPNNGSVLDSLALEDNRLVAIAGCPDGGVIIVLGNKSTATTKLGHNIYQGSNVRKYDSSLNLIWSFTESTMTNIYALAVDVDNHFYIGGEDGSSNTLITAYDAGTSSVDPAQKWSKSNNDGPVWRLMIDGSSYVVAGTDNGSIIKRDIDDGSLILDVDKDDTGNQQLHALDIHPGNPALLEDWAL